MTAEMARPQVNLIRYSEEDRHVEVVHAVAYARFSTDNQLSTSTTDQLRLIRRAVELGQIHSVLFPKSRIVIVGEFHDDGVSGFGVIGRDGLDRALSCLRQNKAKLVIVADFKRFLRGMGTALTIYDYLIECGAELIAVSDGFSSAMKNGRLQFMSRAYHSEEFLDAISNDTRRGLNERRYEGFSDGHLWFGVGSKATRQIPVKGRMKGSYYDYFIITENAAVVVRIFMMYVSGHSQKEIARILNTEGVPPPAAFDRKTGSLKERQSKMHKWRDRTIWQILNNKAYIGVIERGRTKQLKRADGTRQTVEVPKSQWLVIERPDLRIVSQDIWNAARERVREYNQTRLRKVGDKRPFRHDGTTNHVLTGLCACAECGGPFVVVSGRKGGYYGCARSHREHTCSNRRMIANKKFELPFLHWIVDQLKDDSICVAMAEKYNQLRRARTVDEANDLSGKETRLAEVEGALANILQAVERGAASEMLLHRMADLEREKDDLAKKIKFLRGIDLSEVYVTPTAIKRRFKEIPALLQKMQPFEVNRAIKPLIGKSGLKLVWRAEEGDAGCYWMVGSINLGNAMGMVPGKPTPTVGGMSMEVPVEIRLG